MVKSWLWQIVTLVICRFGPVTYSRTSMWIWTRSGLLRGH